MTTFWLNTPWLAQALAAGARPADVLAFALLAGALAGLGCLGLLHLVSARRQAVQQLLVLGLLTPVLWALTGPASVLVLLATAGLGHLLLAYLSGAPERNTTVSWQQPADANPLR